MKLLKIFGAFLFCLGCIAAIIGISAMLLPGIDNPQIQKLLAAFGEPSDRIVVKTVNAVMTYALGNCYVVMLGGAGMVMFGAVIMLFSRKPNDGDSPEPIERAASMHEEQSAERAYRIAESDESNDEVRIWRSSPAAEVNPYADASLVSMLAPSHDAKHAKTVTNPFAASPAGEAQAENAYQRPKHEPQRSQSAGAADDTASLFSVISQFGGDKREDEGEAPILTITGEPAVAAEVAPVKPNADERPSFEPRSAAPGNASREYAPPRDKEPSLRVEHTAYAPQHRYYDKPDYYDDERVDRVRPNPETRRARGYDALSEHATPPRRQPSNQRRYSDAPSHGEPSRRGEPVASRRRPERTEARQSHPSQSEGVSAYAEPLTVSVSAPKGASLRMSAPTLPPIAPKAEETLYRAPDYMPSKDDSRPRIRSTFRKPTATDAPPAFASTEACEEPAKPRIKISMGKRD